MILVAVLFSLAVFAMIGSCFHLAWQMYQEKIPGAVMAAALGVFTLAFYISLWLR